MILGFLVCGEFRYLRRRAFRGLKSTISQIFSGRNVFTVLIVEITLAVAKKYTLHERQLYRNDNLATSTTGILILSQAEVMIKITIMVQP